MDIVDPHDEPMIVRQSGDELLVLDVRANLVHQLNGTASIIWRLSAEGNDAEAIAAEITRRFDVNEQRARQDVVDTLELLGSRGLLRQAAGVSFFTRGSGGSGTCEM